MRDDTTTCLIVSGDRDMHETLLQMMAGYPFLFHEAATGKQALTFCGQVRPDVMLLDCELPDMDCAGLINLLDGMFAQDMPAILACSSQGNLQQISDVMHGGANECIIKPFDAELLDFKLRLIGAVKGPSC